MAEAEKKDIHMSTHHKERKNLAYLQKMKDNGEKIVQMCPAELGPIFGLAAEMVGCDVLRTPSIVSLRGGLSAEEDVTVAGISLKKYREYLNVIHINFYMPTCSYASKVDALKYGAQWVFYGADSMLPMG
ncbi:MAG: hypothetical protein Q4C25_05805, partial [Bacillota bacterium]|nr:hypothetical protein [Bacillota bacterium]